MKTSKKAGPSPQASSALQAVTGDTLRPGGLDVTRVALNACRLPKQAVVLDIGCGLGASLNLFSQHGHTAVGLDLDRQFLQRAARHAPVVLADAHSLPFATASADAVFCECVLSLLAQPGKMLQECFRVLRPQGLLLVSDITRRADTEAPAGSSCLSGAKILSELVLLLESAGFVLRVHIDFPSALKELSAQWIWKFGSMESFWNLWQRSAVFNTQEGGALPPEQALSANSPQSPDAFSNCAPSPGHGQSAGDTHRFDYNFEASPASAPAFGYMLFMAEKGNML